MLRCAKTRHGWALVLAASTIGAMSGFFEVLESWVAQVVSPELGMAYLPYRCINFAYLGISGGLQCL